MPEQQELIEVIYETVLDENFWPDILQGLSQEINRIEPKFLPAYLPNDTLVTDKEAQLIQSLIPFFKQAFELNKQYSKVFQENRILKSLMERLPIGILIIDRQMNIITMNPKAKAILGEDSGVYYKENHLEFQNYQIAALLKQHIETSPKEMKKLSVNGENGQGDCALLVAPFQDDSGRAEYFSIFLASPKEKVVISSSALNSEYNISKSEARLINALMNNKTIAQFATETGLSENTLRFQLKSIYKKTKVNRLPQLITQIMSSPSFFYQAKTEDHEIKKVRLENGSERTIRLKDGRHLTYAQEGNCQGETVIFLHGKYGCRLLQHPDSSITRQCRIRLIKPDRAGYGNSDALTIPGFINWTQDFLQLLDTLEVERCSIIGLETGGAYALACAHEFPQRIRKLILCNAYSPNMTLKDFAGCVPNERLFFALAKYTPSLFRNLMELRLKGLFTQLDWYYEKLMNYLPDCDKALLGRQDNLEMLHRTSIEAISKPQGFINDIILITRDWGFSLDGIDTPVEIWHGMQNVHIPPINAKRLQDVLPNNKPFLLQNQGHFLALPYWNNLLLAAKAHQNPNQLCWLA